MKAFAASLKAGDARCPVRALYSRWVTASSLKTRRRERASGLRVGVCNVGDRNDFRALGFLVRGLRVRAASATRARTRSAKGDSGLEDEEPAESLRFSGMGSCQGEGGPASA